MSGSAAQPWLNDPVAPPSGNAAQPWLNDPQAGPTDTSFGGALQQGAHDALSGLGSTVGLLSKDAGFQGGEDAGKWLQDAIAAPANYKSAGGTIVSDLKSGAYLDALKKLPRAAVEGAPAVAGGLATAAGATLLAPEALAGAAGAGGAALYGAATNFGDNANARAAAQGHSSPTPGDQAVAGLTSAAQGGLQAVGLGKVPGVGGLIAKAGAGKFLATGALDAAGSGAANLAGQAGDTVGTEQGLTVDPAQAEAAAAQALAARGAGTLAGQVKSAAGAGVSALGTKLVTGDLPPMTDSQAASYTRINNAVPDATAAATAMRGGANPTNILNSMHKQLKPQVGAVLQAIKSSGLVSDSEFATILQPAFQQAAVHKSAITNMPAVESLNLPPQLKTTLVNGLTDLDSLSQMVNYKQASGPFAAIGAKVAQVGTVVGGVATAALGHPVEGLGAASAAMMGTHGGLAANVGRFVGGGLDKAVGTNAPPAILLKSQALKQATAAGYPTDVNTGADLASAHQVLTTPTAPPTPTDLATQAAQKQAFSVLSKVGPNHPAGMAAIPILPQPMADQAIEQFRQTTPLREGMAQAQQNDQFDKAYGQADAMDFQRDQKLGAQFDKTYNQADAMDFARTQAIQAKGIQLNEQAANQLSGQQYRNSEDAVVARAKMAAQRREWINAAKDDGRIPLPMSQDQRDRVSIGLPPSDPIPVNTPLDANNQPLQAPNGPPATRVAPPAPQAPVAPPQAPQAPQAPPNVSAPPQGAPQPVAPPSPTQEPNWQTFAKSQLLGMGVPATNDTVTTALNNLSAQGKIAADHATALQAHTGFLGDRTDAFQQVIQQAHLDHGMTPPAPPPAPIRDLARWQGAANNYQQLAQTLQSEAANEGDPDLARVIARARAVSSGSQKVQIAEQFLASKQSDPLALARAKRLLVPELLQGK